MLSQLANKSCLSSCIKSSVRILCLFIRKNACFKKDARFEANWMASDLEGDE